MKKTSTQSALKALLIILQPIARFCLKFGISAQDAYQVIKKVFVLETAKRFEAESSYNVSKISSQTGINRREINNIIAELDSDPIPHHFPILTRVVGLWLTEDKYLESSKPKALTFGTSDSEFHNLVTQISKDISPGTISDQLLQDGAVEVIDNKLKLKHSAYTPSKNFDESIQMVSSDVSDLINSVIENIESESPINHHLTTEFDSIPLKSSAKISEWLRESGQEFHNKIRNYLKESDDESIEDSSQKCRVVFGSFGRVEKNEDE